MTKLIFQTFAVGLRSILVFVFIFVLTTHSNAEVSSQTLLEFTYASIFSCIISFGFDYSLVQDGKKSIELLSFLAKLVIGTIIVILIIYCQSLNTNILFYSFSLSCASIFKGLVRLKQVHKADFFVNLSSLLVFLALVYIINITDFLWGLSISILISNLIALYVKSEFYINSNFSEIFNTIHSSAPLALYSVISYLLLNVDVYIFDYLGKVNSYQDFTIPNRFFLNLTMVPVIFMNYRISHVFASDNKNLQFFREFNLLGIILSIGAFIVSEPIINLISNSFVSLNVFEKFLFSLIVYMRTINTHFSMIILKKLDNWYRFFIMSFTLILHILVLYFMVDKFDWSGAIYSVTISTFVFLAINFSCTKKYLFDVK